ncbi:MAG: fructosamine kinase family protein, partial [Bdellovibrionales bacterium]|nr:fructosamine kinase family protein [Bdellovibrionales bacterium]
MKKRLEDLLNKKILNLAPVSGGCIAQSYRVSCDDGSQYFVKTHSQDLPRLFACEAHGLSELSKAEAVLVPLPTGTTYDFLILPFIETSEPNPGFWREF